MSPTPEKRDGTAPFTSYTSGGADKLHTPTYTRKNFIPEDFRVIVDMMAEKIRAIMLKHPGIEALAACGHSGLMMMGALSYITGLPQIAVRKPHPSDHDKKLVNGWMGCKGFLIIDDFVSSGATVRKIVLEIQKAAYAEHVLAAEAMNASGKPTPEPLVKDLPQPIACLMYNQCGSEMEAVSTIGGVRIEIPNYSVEDQDLDILF